MPDESPHAAVVETWLERNKDHPYEVFLTLLERLLDALWRRSVRTLGEVTMNAILERVLYQASESYPFLSSVKVVGGRIRLDELFEQEPPVRDTDLEDGARLVLVTFLSFMGDVTAEILTPALHAVLSGVQTTAPLERARSREDAES